MLVKKVTSGIFWVEIPEADLRILCGCPADSVKHLKKVGLVAATSRNGVNFETGPNAILFSDTPIQNGCIANLAEFPVLQMLYLQGMIIPNHPGNTGSKPMLIGLEGQVRSQSEYIFRGNYGLVSHEELVAAGVPALAAADMMRIKRWFAFGRIRGTQDLVELKIVDQTAIELKPGVFVHRRGLNLYEFLFAGHSALVDLNLAEGEEYAAPYRLSAGGFRRETFSIIHIGEGDGWDPAKPCMSSMVCFQGRLYLIDAGPNLLHSLTTLGISVNEIEGIFHTHAHDDHFAGFTTLTRSDRRLKYFAAPFVRACVEKKLAALMDIDAQGFRRLFDVHDLEPGQWNMIDGLEVRPLYSPHPVETTVLFFRASGKNGRHSYAHLADLPSFDVLRRMSAEDPAKDGMSPAAIEAFMRDIREPADIKKIDAGGGQIHGQAADFRADGSGRIIISHTGLALSEAQKEIGSRVEFGQADVFIPAGRHDYRMEAARSHLSDCFPGMSERDLAGFMKCAPVSFAAGACILEKGVLNTHIHLILDGVAEFTDPAAGLRNRISAGTLVGELSGYAGETARRSYRAVSAITALGIPCDMYRSFIRKNKLDDLVRRVHENRQFLFNTSLFGESISMHIQSQIARLMEKRSAAAGSVPAGQGGQELYLLAEGELSLFTGERLIEVVRPGDFWGELGIIGRESGLCEARARVDIRYFAIPAGPLLEIPIVQGKLLEAYNRRLNGLRASFRFKWLDFYAIGVQRIDDQHRRLVELIDEMHGLTGQPVDRKALRAHMSELFDFTRLHFEEEEALLRLHASPELDAQQREHAGLLKRLEAFFGDADSIAGGRSAGEYFRDWLIRHTLLEDRKYMQLIVGRKTV